MPGRSLNISARRGAGLYRPRAWTLRKQIRYRGEPCDGIGQLKAGEVLNLEFGTALVCLSRRSHQLPAGLMSRSWFMLRGGRAGDVRSLLNFQSDFLHVLIRPGN